MPVTSRFYILGSALIVTTSVLAPGVAARASNEAVKTDVQNTLKADPSLDDSSITVTSVKDGSVLLGGGAASLDDLVRALRLTAGRPGVGRVFSKVEALGTFTASGARTLGPPLEAVPRAQHGDAAGNDAVIQLGVESALQNLPGRDAENVHVHVKNGVVRLTGTVPTAAGNPSRVSAARSVVGVKSVINETRVVALNLDAR